MREGILWTKRASCRRRILALLLVVAVYGLAGCEGGSAGPPIDPAELLLDESDYPPGWSLCDSGKYRNPGSTEGAEEMAFKSFCFAGPQARAGQDIYRFRSERKAARKYRYLEKYFFSGIHQTPEVSLEGLRADQWHFACKYYQDVTICKILARYDEYIVFSTAMRIVEGQEVLTLSGFISMIRRIDQKMVERIAEAKGE